MRTTGGRQIVTWILSGLLALAFLAAGAPKILAAPFWVRRFAAWGFPAWFLTVVGCAEVAGAVLLLIPRLRRAAVVLLLAVMLGAAATHLAHGEALQILRPLLYAAVLGVVGYRPRGPRRKS